MEENSTGNVHYVSSKREGQERIDLEQVCVQEIENNTRQRRKDRLNLTFI